MPYRINGIGTTYLGKQNVQTEQGVCGSCGRPGALSNYETRLWFSVFFIPVIPLAKRQILSYCPRCTRHRAMSIGEWQDVQAKAIGEAMAKVDAEPDSPEHAIDCHATLAACGKREEAGRYAETMLSRFGDRANVQMYLGAWFERTGQSARADECFDRALKAEPQNPAALRAVAVGLAQENKPREAEEKLSTLKPPSNNYEPSVFYAVATAYQRAGDHESALRLFKMVADATPSAAKEKKFRAAVRESENALGKVGAVFAPLPWYKRKSVVWPAIAATVILVLVGFDRYFAQKRELFVVNGLPKPLKVKLDGAGAVDVPAQGRLKLVAGEGAHTISVVEPAVLARDEQFTIAGNLWARWRGKDVNLVDPTHSAVVVWEESVYAKNPRDQGGDFRLHVAEPFLSLTNIDYKFEDFPHRLQVESGRKKVIKHRVGLETASPLEILVGAPDALTGERRLDYLEAHLATAPDRGALLRYYWQAAVEQQQMVRCRDFLRRFVGNRPVDVELHRTYQSASELSSQQAQLASEYDAMVAKEPRDADLLYLRGRIEPYGADSARFFEAALRANPNHSFTWSANAFRLSGAGQFEEALAAIEKAIAGNVERGELKGLRRRMLQSLGRHDQVAKELREQIKSGEAHIGNIIPI